jgi:hypothetical protein
MKPSTTRQHTPGPQRQDLTGQTFGSLRVIELRSVQSRHGYWLCECLRPSGPRGGKCGQRKIVRDTKLRGGYIVSCGCARRDPEVRRTARMKVPKQRRLAIAKLGALAAAKLTARKTILKPLANKNGSAH